MVNETVAVLRDQVENLRAELANMRARREQDMRHVESLLKERDEALVKLERANALLKKWLEAESRIEIGDDPGDETRAYLYGTSDTNPRI